MASSTEIEDIYPLTTTQRGMLFHSLYAPHSGVYFQQESFLLRGELDVAAFVRAWEYVIARHPILRTAVIWEGIDEPMQVVLREVRLPLEQHDWRALDPEERQARVERFLEADRARGFDMAAAPLMRLALIRLADDAYQFVWGRHHLVLDGWSTALVMREALLCCTAFQRGLAPTLERPRPYRDYMAWLKRQDVASAEAFWRAALAGFRAATPLGVDHESHVPAGQERYVDQWSFISADDYAALQAQARAQRLTVNTLFQGAWALMLSRYSGIEDVLFGATGSGRPPAIPGIESMAGLFINTLPVRVRAAPGERVAPWLQQILAQQAAARRYDYSSLVDIQGWSETPRGQPLFESLLVFENFPVALSESDLPADLEIRSVQSFECTNYPLNLAVLVRDELELRTIYDADRFDAATIRRLQGHLHTLLAGMLADPARRLADLPFLTEPERAQLLALGAGGDPVADAAASVAQAFEAQAARTPHADALVFEQRRLSYAELNERANQLAHHLRGLGVGPGARVGLCVDRSVDLVVGLLGALKAGSAFVPLDPADPPARLLAAFEQARATALLTHARLIGGFSGAPSPGPDPIVVRLDADWPAISRAPTANLPASDPGGQAAVLPAGGRFALLDQRALFARVALLQRSFALAEGEAVLHSAALTQPAAAWEICWPLTCGGRLIVALPGGHEDPEYLRQAIDEQRVGVARLAPVALLAALDYWERAPAPPPAALRAALYAGDSLSPAQIERFAAAFGCALYQLYDAPEAPALALRRLWPEPSAAPALAAPAGYVLDAALRPVPLGVVGDLYLPEPGLARGYDGRPDLTAERFLPNPFAPTMGAVDPQAVETQNIASLQPPVSSRLYRTGDRARRLSDGSIELAGASERHAWIGGVRVDLAEVEAALLADPAIEDCAVLAREAIGSGPELVAYVVASGAFAPERLRAQVGARLPAALRPAAYIPLAYLPLTPAGQVDYPALAAMPLIDAATARRWEDAIGALPGVAQAAALIQEWAERPPALHLDDLLPERRSAADRALDAPPAPPSGQPVDGLAGPPALADGGPLDAPEDAPRTLTAALIRTAERHGRHAIIHIRTDGSAHVQTYAELLDEARRVLSGLAARGLAPGDAAILQCERLSDHLPAFWGCILGGILPVTVAAAPAYTAENSVVNKLYNAWELLGHPPILASDDLVEPIGGLRALLPMPDLAIYTIGELRANPPAERIHPADPDDLAFLQLTSGSTGIPRCIQERHSSVIAYAHASRQVNRLAPDDVALNWLPIDHVGALLMFHIRDLYLGCSQVQARTDMILAEPLAWLDLIERYRVTHTWSPNFGYKLLSDALAKAPGRVWDLSSVKEFLNGGEQVTLPVLREFLAAVAGFNFAPHAMQPAYGMAETCTAMTHVREFSVERSVGFFDKSSLYGRLRRVPAGDPSATIFIEVGPPNPGVRIRIVDRENRTLPEGVIGRLQVQGAIITPGYLNNPEANREAFTDDGWFYTGDLAFILDGRLTITGREKEVIIINGANYYCYEIEDVVKRVAGVEPTNVGVCDVSDPATGTEGLAVFFTPTVDATSERLAVIKTIRARVIAGFGLNPLAIIPVPKDEFPKTTSGKIQRTQLKQALASGQFRAIVKDLDIQLENANTLPDWFFRKIWRRRDARAGAQPGQALIFMDDLGLGAALVGPLGSPGRPCVAVEAGAEFARMGRERYRIAPDDPAHYRSLLDSLARDGVSVDHILHLWTYAPPGAIADADALDRALDQGVYSVLHLVQALAQTHDGARPIRLDVASLGAQPIAPGEALACERAALPGLIKTIPHELPWLSSRHIDLPAAPAAQNAARLLREARDPGKEREVAYRDGRRMVARLAPAGLPSAPARPAPFKPGGLYLLSGGLGGVGATVARELRRRYDARLLLIGRTPLPDQDGGDDRTAERRRNWESLRQMGDGVMYAAVDVCDAEGLRRAVTQAQQRWGRELDGVLHLAGTYHDELLTEATRASFAETLRPKLAGALALHQLVKDRPGSLFVSFSSVHGFFGGFNVGAYAAANSFLDAFARIQRDACALDSFSLAWSLWDGLGISRDFAMADRLVARGYGAMSAQQGLDALLAALHHDQPALLIGLDRSRPPIRRAAEAGPARAHLLRAYYAGPAPRDQLRELTIADRYGVRSACDLVQLPDLPLGADGAPDRQALAALADARPAETSAYVAPQTELERTIAAIWQAALKVEKVGAFDNFFDLGGQSLLMTQVQGKLRAQLGRDISMVDMFKYPTINALASYLSREQPAPAPPQAQDRTTKQREAISRHRQQAKNRR